jgi:hypothetical protein
MTFRRNDSQAAFKSLVPFFCPLLTLYLSDCIETDIWLAGETWFMSHEEKHLSISDEVALDRTCGADKSA